MLIIREKLRESAIFQGVIEKNGSVAKSFISLVSIYSRGECVYRFQSTEFIS